MKTRESSENYLETILVLSSGGRQIRAVDIANELDYAKPSVSVALKKLRYEGYIDTDADGHITLTETGRKTAESVYEKHTLIADWLIFLGVDPKTAVNDACRVEHVMSEQSFAALKKHIENWKHDVYRLK
jgi:Mn-dependent DtxR family transcriptional regulator